MIETKRWEPCLDGNFQVISSFGKTRDRGFYAVSSSSLLYREVLDLLLIYSYSSNT